MKTHPILIALAAALLAGFALPARAQLVIPSDGSDGDLIVTNNLVIDLSLARTAAWDANNAVNKGNGIYDSNKWAVVFKYNSVTVSNGATVTFANHPSRAPVVWLVKGDVTIEGAVSLDGSNYVPPPGLAEPGPGGFRAGTLGYTPGVYGSAGFGPGGGGRPGQGYGGSYGSSGSGGTVPYGNPSLLPLIGGSGGAGGYYFGASGGGGGGGGAILIATRAGVTLNGVLRANGGVGWQDCCDGNRHSGGGSGGGVRIISSSLAGSGVIQALGGSAVYPGGLGRVRIERVTVGGALQVTPDPSVVPLEAAATPLLWLPQNGPTARIVSIGGSAVPADPRASFGASGADVALPSTSTTPVVVETTNAEDASVVSVRVTPRSNANYTETIASNPQVISTSPLVIRWTADVPVNGGYSAVQVKVVRP